jgi:hypothetical protein
MECLCSYKNWIIYKVGKIGSYRFITNSFVFVVNIKLFILIGPIGYSMYCRYSCCYFISTCSIVPIIFINFTTIPSFLQHSLSSCASFGFSLFSFDMFVGPIMYTSLGLVHSYMTFLLIGQIRIALKPL